MFFTNKQIEDPKWWLKSVPKYNSWTDINILRFLRLYENHPMLWDITNSQYNNRITRYSAYKHITKILKLKNVDEKKCMRLVEFLKKKYVEVKVYGRKRNDQPAWFAIINGIINRLLNLQNIQGKEVSVESYKACKECCTKQNLSSSRWYYRENSERSSNSLQACKVRKASCDHFMSLNGSENNEENENRCMYTVKVKYYTVPQDDVPMVLVKFGSPLKKERAKNADLIYEYDNEKSSTISPSINSTKSNDDNCCFDDLSGQSTVSISSSSDDVCVQDLLVQKIFTQASSFNYQAKSGNQSTSLLVTSRSKEKLGVEKFNGLFMDSFLLHRKPISLMEEHRFTLEDFNTCLLKIIKHKGYFTTDKIPNFDRIYPLQLDF